MRDAQKRLLSQPLANKCAAQLTLSDPVRQGARQRPVPFRQQCPSGLGALLQNGGRGWICEGRLVLLYSPAARRPSQNERLRHALGFLHLARDFLLDGLFLRSDGGEPVLLALQRIEIVAA